MPIQLCQVQISANFGAHSFLRIPFYLFVNHSLRVYFIADIIGAEKPFVIALLMRGLMVGFRFQLYTSIRNEDYEPNNLVVNYYTT